MLLVVVGRLIVAVMVFKFCVFFFLQWWWVYLIFTYACFLVGFLDDFCCKFSWIWVVVMVASGFGL